MTDDLNSTFLIEEEKSFLNIYGTPIQFKKLMEKPATVPMKSTDMDTQIHNTYLSPFKFQHNFSPKSNKKPENQFKASNHQSFEFLSPLDSFNKSRQVNCMRNSPNLLSPIDFGRRQPINYSESTPNPNRVYNKHLNVNNCATPETKNSRNLSQNPNLFSSQNKENYPLSSSIRKNEIQSSRMSNSFSSNGIKSLPMSTSFVKTGIEMAQISNSNCNENRGVKSIQKSVMSIQKQKEIENTNVKFSRSTRNTTKAQFTTPVPKVVFQPTESPDILWSLNKKREDAEKARLENIKLEEANRHVSWNENSLSIVDKVQKFAEEMFGHKRKVEPIQEVEKNPIVTSPESPGFREAFLAKRAEQMQLETKLIDEKQNIPSLTEEEKCISFMENLKKFNAWKANNNITKTNTKILTTPLMSRQVVNTNSVRNTKSKMPIMSNKLGFVTPANSTRAVKVAPKTSLWK